MQLTIDSVDYAPPDLYDQSPIVAELLREMPGTDRSDYWLAELATPVRWVTENHERKVTHLVLAARWQGTRIVPGVARLPVAIAYVTDQSLLHDRRLQFRKCTYVAIGLAHDTTDGRGIARSQDILAGHIGTFFGTGTKRSLWQRLLGRLRFWAA